MKILIVSFTKKGAIICLKITEGLRKSGYMAIGFSKYVENKLLLLEDKLNDFTKRAFEENSAIVFVGATGIAVRAIAPFIASKDRDPAIIVVDELGKYIIPILSGHLGGANEISKEIADILKGKAVITTATDINDVFAVDVWAVNNNLYIENIDSIKYISAAVLKGEKIGFCCDYPVEGDLYDFMTQAKAEVGIYIMNQNVKKSDETFVPFLRTLRLRPKLFFVGIGCRKGTDEKVLEEFFIETLTELDIPMFLVSKIVTIDIKKEEKAIVKLCEKHRYPLETFTSEQLSRAKGEFTSSEFVKSSVGVDNVCERAAYIASNAGKIILKKTVKNKCTIAIALGEWRCSFK